MSNCTTLLTFSGQLNRVRSVNSTTTSFTHPTATRTEPVADAGTATGQATINLVNTTAGSSQNGVLIVPYSTGNDDDTFDVRVIGWKEVFAADPAQIFWFPIELAQFSCTVSTYTGVANGLLTTTSRFADTIVLVRPTADNAHVTIHSPANNTPAHILIDCKGCAKFEVLFDATDADVTGMNALYSLL